MEFLIPLTVHELVVFVFPGGTGTPGLKNIRSNFNGIESRGKFSKRSRNRARNYPKNGSKDRSRRSQWMFLDSKRFEAREKRKLTRFANHWITKFRFVSHGASSTGSKSFREPTVG